ncbi:MAG: molecular chaperone TorD family protein [Armatimonadota bacterium]
MNTKDSAAISFEDVDLYTFFYLLLEKPGPGQRSLVMDQETSSLLSKVAGYLHVADFQGADQPTSIEEAESSYLSLFEVGLPAPPCPLNESPYNRTAPPTKVIHENLLFYRAFGLDLKTENTELPDHICNQLEFLSYLTRLLEQSTDAESVASILAGKRDFVERHVLSWVPTAARKLQALDERLYAPILELLEAYVRLDMVACSNTRT